MVQPASKRLVTEAALQDPANPAGAFLSSTIAASVEHGRVAPSLNPITTYAQPDKYVLAQSGTTLYAKGTVGVPPVLYVSTDGGKTWATRSTLPAKVDYLYKMKNTGTLIIIEGETVSTLPTTPGQPRVWRSTDDGATWTLIPGVLNVPPLGSSGIVEGTDGSLMISEYAALRPWQYRVRRTTDDGLTWTTVLSSDGRDPGAGDPGHIHSLTYDPVAGRHNVFMDYTIVDGVDGPQIWSSADNGATWELLGKSTSVDQPNFVTPMYFSEYIAWGSDNQVNGRMSRLKRADFYAGRFNLTEHVQQVSQKAIYGAFRVRPDVYLVAVNGEHIKSGLQTERYSTMTEVYVVTNEGLSVSAGVSTYRASTVPGELAGVRAQFPTHHYSDDHRGLAWVNFPAGGPRPSYGVVPLTQGWEPPVQQAVTVATPNIVPGGPLTIQRSANPDDMFTFISRTDAGVTVIGDQSMGASSRSEIDYLADGTVEFRSNGALVGKLAGGVLLAWGRIDTAVSGVGLRSGTSTPEAITAPAGTIYQQTGSGNHLWRKTSNSAALGWQRITTPAVPTTDLASAANVINTVGKYAGMPAYDTTVGRPVWSSGTTATSAWKYADGTVAVTPA